MASGPGFSASDGYVAKLTDAGPAGTFTWAQQVAGGGARASALAVNGASVYVAGVFHRPATFGSPQLTSAGGFDAFVAKVTDAGATAGFTWAQQAGGADADSATALAVRGHHVVVAGTFSRSAARFGATSLVNSGLRDVFVAKLLDAGPTAGFAWAQAAGGAADDYATAVALSGTAVYVAGAIGPPAAFGGLTVAAPANGQAGFLADLADAALAATAPALAGHAFTLAPNPARDRTTVYLAAVPGATSATLVLTDALGRTVRRHAAALSASGLRHELSLTGLAPGVYVLRTDAGGSSAVRRVVVE
jgi:hypothetical protein